MSKKELKKKILPLMYCYLGSGMFTDDYSEEVANKNADKCIELMEQYANQKVLLALEEVKNKCKENADYIGDHDDIKDRYARSAYRDVVNLIEEVKPKYT